MSRDCQGATCDSGNRLAHARGSSDAFPLFRAADKPGWHGTRHAGKLIIDAASSAAVTRLESCRGGRGPAKPFTPEDAMRRGRVVFWSVSGVIIAAGAGLYLWLHFTYLRRPGFLPVDARVQELKREQLARAERPPEPWAPAEAWWKRNTIDAFDQVTKGKHWPSARRAVVAFGWDLGGDPPRTGDEAADARSAAATAVEHQCDDPLVLYVLGRYLFRTGDSRQRDWEGAPKLAEAADAFAAPAGADRK